MMRTTHGHSSEEGFTLVEVLAALVIIGLISSSLLIIRDNSIQEARTAVKTRIAWSLAKRKYNKIKSKKDIRPSSGTFRDHEQFRWEYKIQQAQLGNLFEDFKSDKQNAQNTRQLYLVTLSISYPVENKETRNEITLSHYRFLNIEQGK